MSASSDIERRWHANEKRAFRIISDAFERALDPIWEQENAPTVVDALLVYLVQRHGFHLAVAKPLTPPSDWERWYHGPSGRGRAGVDEEGGARKPTE